MMTLYNFDNLLFKTKWIYIQEKNLDDSGNKSEGVFRERARVCARSRLLQPQNPR